VRLPEIHLINPWLLGEECKPIIIRDANKAFHLLPQGTLSNFYTNAQLRIGIYFFTSVPLHIYLYLDAGSR
jgi:hypothetical protein